MIPWFQSFKTFKTVKSFRTRWKIADELTSLAS